MHIHTDIYACTFTRILLLQQKLCYKILSALLTYYLNQARHTILLAAICLSGQM